MTLLDEEIMKVRMTKALKGLIGLDLPRARTAAYIAADIPSEAIIEWDAEALRREELRRSKIDNRKSAAAMIALFGGFYCAFSCDPTRAATLDAAPIDHSGLAWIVAGIVIGALLFLAIARRFAGPDPFPCEADHGYARKRPNYEDLDQ